MPQVEKPAPPTFAEKKKGRTRKGMLSRERYMRGRRHTKAHWGNHRCRLAVRGDHHRDVMWIDGSGPPWFHAEVDNTKLLQGEASVLAITSSPAIQVFLYVAFPSHQLYPPAILTVDDEINFTWKRTRVRRHERSGSQCCEYLC